MKIGIALAGISPEEGGGFTFEGSVYSAIAQLETQHEIYIFHKGELQSEPNPNFKYIRLDANKSVYTPPPIHRRILSKLRRLFVKSFVGNAFYKHDSAMYDHEREIRELDYYSFYKNPLNAKVKELGIEMVWFVTSSFQPVEAPYIYTLWDLGHRNFPFLPEYSHSAPMPWEARERLWRGILPKATYIVTGAEVGKAEVLKYYHVQEKQIIINPFPTPNFAQKTDYQNIDVFKSFGIKKEYLYFPAQFWAHKNHVVLLYAIKQLKEKNNLDFDVVFTGSDKGNMAHVKSVAEKLGVEKNIHFLGFVSVEEMVSLYKNAFALTFTSILGPDNLPPLEAMALGCPVISSEYAGAHEQLRDAALFFEPTNEEELAEQVVKLKQNPKLREQLIGKGKKRACEHSANDYVARIIGKIDGFGKYRRNWK